MLRLRAETPDDVPVLSALVQDALVQRRDIYFDSKARRLVLLMQRFCWEANGTCSRARAALRIEFVSRVAHKNILDRPQAAVFDLLSLQMEGDTCLVLDFAGGAALRCDVETVDVVLEDITQAWDVRVIPNHQI